jgi:hypothetical protein
LSFNSVINFSSLALLTSVLQCWIGSIHMLIGGEYVSEEFPYMILTLNITSWQAKWVKSIGATSFGYKKMKFWQNFCFTYHPFVICPACVSVHYFNHHGDSKIMWWIAKRATHINCVL